MKIRMSLSVSPVRYLTAGKEYELYSQGVCPFIYDDFQKKTLIVIAKCPHLGGAHWERVPEQAEAFDNESFCTFADLKAGEYFILAKAEGQEARFPISSTSVFLKTAFAGEAIVVGSKDYSCLIGAKASFWPDCPVRKITVSFGGGL